MRLPIVGTTTAFYLPLLAGTAVLLIGLGGTPAIAEDAATPLMITPEMQAAFQEARPFCEADAGKYCRWVLPGGGRIVKCMFEHFDDLSPVCQEKLSEFMSQ
jgi:hypothetical protein